MNKPRRTAPLISLSLVVALIASCSSPECGRVEIAHRATVIISAPGFTASDIEDFSTPFEQDDLSVLIEDLPDIAAFERPAGPVALISLGRRASSDWKAAEQGAEHLRSVAFVSVPALRNLETDQLKGVPLLELHSILDRETSVAHQSIHDALSVAGVPHEAVTYDGVGANFFAKGDPQYDPATARDAAGRVHEWIMTALTTRELDVTRNIP